MKRPPPRGTFSLVALLLAPLVFSTSGCCTTRTHGQARVQECPVFIGRPNERSANLTLPSVPLTMPGTTWIAIRGLRHRQWAEWRLLPLFPWKDEYANDPESYPSRGAIVTVQVRAPGGGEMYRRRIEITQGSNIEGLAASVDGLADFDVGITVERPSAGKASAQVTAFTFYIPGKGYI